MSFNTSWYYQTQSQVILNLLTDSPAAVSAMRSKGHKPNAYTPTGAHFYFKMPAQLKSIPPQHSVVFGNLSEVRVMSGNRLVLIPPSRVLAA